MTAPKYWKKRVYRELKEKNIHTVPCWICGKNLSADVATVDHVIPKSRGGLNHESNYRMACGKCNWKKGSTILSRKGKPKRNWNAAQRGY